MKLNKLTKHMTNRLARKIQKQMDRNHIIEEAKRLSLLTWHQLDLKKEEENKEEVIETQETQTDSDK